MKIQFEVKRVWGKDLLYIVDEDQRRMINRLTGKVTVTVEDLQTLKALGCEVVQVINTIKL